MTPSSLSTPTNLLDGTESPSTIPSFSLSLSATWSALATASIYDIPSQRATVTVGAVTRTSTSLMSLTATSTETTTSTSSQTPSTTGSLGLRLVTETINMAAIVFDSYLSPSTVEIISNPDIGYAVRLAAANILSLSGVGMMDRVFIATVYEQDTDVMTFFNDSSPINRIGNYYETVDDAMIAIISGAAFDQPSVIISISPSPLPVARLLRNDDGTSVIVRIANSLATTTNSHRRLDLNFFTSNLTKVKSTQSQVITIRFNVLFNSLSAANNALAVAKKTADDAAAAAAAVAAEAEAEEMARRNRRVIAATAPNAIVSAYISVGGSNAINATGSNDFNNAIVVELTYKKSYYALFLEWLQRNIKLVLGGTAAVIVLFFLIFFVKRRIDSIVKNNKAQLRIAALKSLDDGMLNRKILMKEARRRKTMNLFSKFMKAARLFVLRGELIKNQRAAIAATAAAAAAQLSKGNGRITYHVAAEAPEDVTPSPKIVTSSSTSPRSPRIVSSRSISPRSVSSLKQLSSIKEVIIDHNKASGRAADLEVVNVLAEEVTTITMNPPLPNRVIDNNDSITSFTDNAPTGNYALPWVGVGALVAGGVSSPQDQARSKRRILTGGSVLGRINIQPLSSATTAVTASALPSLRPASFLPLRQAFTKTTTSATTSKDDTSDPVTNAVVPEAFPSRWSVKRGPTLQERRGVSLMTEEEE